MTLILVGTTLWANQLSAEQPSAETSAIELTAEFQEVPFNWGLAGAQILIGLPMEGVGLWLGWQSAMGVYDACNHLSPSWETSVSATVACVIGIVVAFRGTALITTSTAVWSVGEIAGHDGSWWATFGGAGIVGILAPGASLVGAIWGYQESIKHPHLLMANTDSPLANPRAQTVPVLQMRF